MSSAAPMRALVTGAKGFVGRHLCARIRSAGVSVTELDLPEVDVRDFSALKLMLTAQRPDLIYHLAAQASVAHSWRDPLATYSANVIGTATLLEAARLTVPTARIVVVSSACVYDGATVSDRLTEADPVRPRSPYGVSKAIAEDLSRNYVNNFGLDVLVARGFNATGPGQDESYVVPALTRKIICAVRQGDGEIGVGNVKTIRDFIDVRDMVSALVALASRGTRGEIYNVCSGSPVSIGDVATSLIRMSGAEVSLSADLEHRRQGDSTRLVGDPSATIARLGWRTEIPLEKTLQDVWADVSMRCGLPT
jgi:GDP-4-dehydro-6-deoxy-D-mannose reductase